jgi:ribosomal protein S18 acetylase RimI-like enzyme
MMVFMSEPYCNPCETGVVIRRAIPGDASRLAVLATQVWLHTYATQAISQEIADYVLGNITPRTFEGTLADPASCVWVAELDANLVGLAVLKLGLPCPHDGASAAELQTLYVQEHFMGQGVGAQLLRTAQVTARAVAQSPLWLSVNAHNHAAIGFYQHMGYVKLGTMDFQLGATRHENHVYLGQCLAAQALPGSSTHQP